MKNQSRIFVLYAVFALAAAQAFAAGDIMPAGMTGLAESILNIFTGPFVKTILIIFLAACAVAYGFNKDNEKMKRNIIAIAVAIAIIIGASSIVDAVYNAAS